MNRRGKFKMTWIILIVATIALITIGCLSLQKKNVSSEIPRQSNFTPNPKNGKFIIVKGWSEIEIRKIINDFIEMYKNDGYLPYKIDFQKRGDNLYQLNFPQDIHPLLFTFLVNYIAYPIDLDFKGRSIIVGGKVTMTTEFDGIDASLSGKKAILYIPVNDQDKNVVYMQTETGIVFANTFDELKWKKVSDPRLSDEVKKLID